jgi:solute carrier family 35 protein E1
MSLITGCMSNLFAALRSVMSKTRMTVVTPKPHHNFKPSKIDTTTPISPENYYSLLTIASLVILVPMTVIMEGGAIWCTFNNTTENNNTNNTIIPINNNITDGLYNALIGGLLFNLYNEFSFRVLQQVSPVTHAVANTARRVVIILLAVWLLGGGQEMSVESVVGSVVTMVGVLVYSVSMIK